MSIRDIVDSMMPDATKIELAGVANSVAYEGYKHSGAQAFLDVQRWLPLAAEKYEISKSIKDYVISPVIIFPTDIPNRNCLAGSTLVATNAGMIPIGNLNARDDATHVLVKNGKARIKNWMRNGFKPVHDIFTNTGRHIRATSTHPFLVFNPSNCIFKWKRVTELEVGDRVIVRTGNLVKNPVDLRFVAKRVRTTLNRLYLSYPGGKGRSLTSTLPKLMTDDLARLLGYFQSEGSFRNNRVTFINTDRDLLKDVQNCILNVFGVNTKIRKRENNHGNFKGNKTAYGISIYRQDVAFWFKEVGLFEKQPVRTVPSIILESNAQHICSYLKAYIEGDGCIEAEQIRIHSSCKTAMLQIQQLLQSLNILSRVTSRPPTKEGGVIHEVSVAESYDALAKIGFVSKTSKITNAAWETARDNRNTHNSRHRMLPIEIRHWVGKIIKQHHIGNSHKGAQYMDYKGNSHFINFEISKLGALTKRPSKEKLLAIRDRLAMLNPAYGQIIDELTGDFVFDAINRIDINSVLEPVYDIETTAAQLTANGVVVHNSVAFPYETLMKFNVGQGRPNYKTWVGKPTYTEHAHHDFTQAKGIVFDTYMRPLEHAAGNIYKLIALCGFDRTKDPELANAILQGKRKSYSMGAWVSQYECAVCGDKSKPGKLNTACGHVIRGKPQIFEVAGHHIPSYLIARQEITGFEVSSVGVPAWSSATNSKIFDMNNLR